MVRAACCDKMGLKKGPWSQEEDEILVTYIQRHGHGNWRALPKQAGLLRCGKSCRLRWINYLRPDIKRGNISIEEEETIMKLHRIVGNRWSAIAARLPGRTDNEIKNYWHSHLKKRLSQGIEATPTTIESQTCTGETKIISQQYHLVNFTTTQYGNHATLLDATIFPQGYSCQEDVVSNSTAKIEHTNYSNNTGEDMMFWYDLLMKAGNSSEIFENMRMFG